MKMKHKQQVIVVEGHHDQQKINEVFPNLYCIITNGSEISDETLNLIYETSLTNEVILFLDPDYPGKQITNKILATGGNYKIAYLQKEKAISSNGKKVGIEHANKQDILAALDMVKEIDFKNEEIQQSDLISRGLIYKKGSKQLRDNLCKSLNIPISNSKTLLKTLNMLHIGLERIDEIIG
jgi:ribonuclease M5